MLIKAAAIDDGASLETDVCIIGAGAAGIALAVELGRAGIGTILLEAGSVSGAAGSQRLYRGTVNDPDRHLAPDRDRSRGLGGTTALWGGRCMPYDPIDFAPRPWIAASGWPIGLDTLEPFYRRAHDVVDCGAYVYEAAAAGLPGTLIEGFRDGAVTTGSIERWSPPTHFGTSFRPELERSEAIRLVTGGVVVGLEADRAGTRVDRVTVRTLRGRRFGVRARRVVLAGGGLESTRLLLVTGRDRPRALGDHSGWLGRGYMTHIGGVVARIVFNPGQRIIFGYEQDPEGVYVRRRFRVSDEAQREHGLVNMYALLDRPLLDDAQHGSAILSLAYLAKRLVQKQSPGASTGSGGSVLGLYWRHVRNLLTGAPEVLSVLPKFGRQRFLSGRRVPSLLLSRADNSYHLYFHAEQTPDPASAVRLSPSCDHLGVPRLSIDFHVNDDDVDRVYRSHCIIDEELRGQGVGRLAFLGADPHADIRACKATLGHHVGTARMAADPADGVVDPDCRVHGVENLYVASSAVLPTSSQAHPTLTIVALALRLADHLRGIDAGNHAASVQRDLVAG